MKQIKNLEKQQIIEPFESSCSSPIWFVEKKLDTNGNKRWRMIIDNRDLNATTFGDAYPLPNLVEILAQLENARYFSTLDLASGFHQIEIHFEDRHKIAFSTPCQPYEFTRMLFGLKNAPTTFQTKDCENMVYSYNQESVIF